MKHLILAGMLLLGAAGQAQATIDDAKPVVQIATAKVKAGTEAAFKASVEKVLQPTRAEAGNISYNYFESIDDPTEFVFIEVWKSNAAIDFHMNTPFIKTFFGEVGPLFETGYPILKKYQSAE